jgi:FKBP-type peptidyl-prolyl cis-trans isomerase FkpA
MNLRPISVIALIITLLSACNRVNVTDSGLKYQFHDENKDARKAKIGEIISLNLTVKNDRDSVLFDSRKQGRPQLMMVQTPPYKGSFEDGLTMLAKGDSATFFVNADTLFTKMGQPMPSTIKKGSEISYTVKVLDIQTEQEFQKTQAEKKGKQQAIDEKIIAAYTAKAGLKTQKTASGLHYVVNKEGTGAPIVAKQVASVRYTGKLLDGTIFDSSEKQGGQPIEFPVGVGAVIPGWDEGLQTMRKGGKTTFLIPSSLGYGEEGSPGAIPSNAVLFFEVELVDIKNMPKQQAQMQQGR